MKRNFLITFLLCTAHIVYGQLSYINNQNPVYFSGHMAIGKGYAATPFAIDPSAIIDMGFYGAKQGYAFRPINWDSIITPVYGLMGLDIRTRRWVFYDSLSKKYIATLNDTASLLSTHNYDINTYVPLSRTLTINGVGYDLNANRSWTVIASADSSIFATRLYVATNYYNKTQSDARYLQSYTETDPVYSLSAAAGVTIPLISHWNQAYNKYAVSGSLSGTTLTLTNNDATTWTIGLNGTWIKYSDSSSLFPTKPFVANTYVPLTRTVNGKALSSDISIGYSDLTGTAPYISNTTDATLTRNGSGPYTLGLNLGNTNTWTAKQTFNTTAPTFGTMTKGSVLFAGTNGVLSQNNSNIFIDSAIPALILGATATQSNCKFLVAGSGGANTAAAAQAGFYNTVCQNGLFPYVSDVGVISLGQKNANTIISINAADNTNNHTITFITGNGTFNVSGTGNSIFGGNIAAGSTCAIVGTTTNNNAITGNIGETQKVKITASVNPPSTGTAYNLTSVTLTAGNWEIEGQITYVANSGTPTITDMFAAINTTSATIPAIPDYAEMYITSTLAAGNGITINAPKQEVKIASTTTYYMVGNCSYTGAIGSYGYILATRIR